MLQACRRGFAHTLTAHKGGTAICAEHGLVTDRKPDLHNRHPMAVPTVVGHRTLRPVEYAP